MINELFNNLGELGCLFDVVDTTGKYEENGKGAAGARRLDPPDPKVMPQVILARDAVMNMNVVNVPCGCYNRFVI